MYIYQADLWCDSCGEKIKADLAVEAHEDTGDSEDVPQYADESQSETDSPSHCAAGADCLEAEDLGHYGLEDGATLHGAESRRVGALLNEGLTEEGVKYVREIVSAPARTEYQGALHALWRERFGIVEPDEDQEAD